MTTHNFTRLFVKAVNPTVTDDNTATPTPHEVGDVWINVTAGSIYQAVDVTTGAAVWSSGGGGVGFNDAEGDPATSHPTTASDGTSSYAARRDHVHRWDFAGGIIAGLLEDPVDGDHFGYRDLVTGNTNRVPWSNLKALLKTYFDTLYVASPLEWGDIGGDLADQLDLIGEFTTLNAALDAHVASVSNPHAVTAAQAGATPENQWIACSETWTRTGNHVFTVAGDLTAKYRKGTKVRYKDGGSFEYGVVKTVAHAAGTTTVTLLTNTDYTMAAVTITDKWISYGSNPEGFPGSFNFAITPGYTGGTTDPTSLTIANARWWVIGVTIFISIRATLVRGTGNRTNIYFPMPFDVPFISACTGMDSITAAGLSPATACYFFATDDRIYYQRTMANDGDVYATGSIPL